MIGILGNGSWATALVKILTDNQHCIHWWMRNESAVHHLQQRHHNPHYLTAVTFDPKYIKPSTDIIEVIENCEIIIIGIPSAYLHTILERLPKDIFKNKTIISAVKGILTGSNQLLNDYLVDNFKLDNQQYIAITGPCHAEEVSLERLSYLTFSGLNDNVTQKIAQYFNTEYIRTGTNHDLWGAQYAAVLKNIYAIGAGIAHGLGYGDNFLSVYITNSYRELYYFSKQQFRKRHHLEVQKPDFHTSAYLGDLLVTCYSLHSRNRAFGNLLGKGYSTQAAINEMKMVAEGYYAVKGMTAIAEDLEIELSIMNTIKQILWDDKEITSQMQYIETLLS